MELNSELERLKKYLPIEQELIKAKEKHQNYNNLHKQADIILEELGEVAKAILQYEDEGGKFENIIKELRHTAAMCMRMLENIGGV